MEINGEATQGITHTRAIELIQAGGNRVHLLLRAGQGLVPDHSEWPLSWAGCSDAQLLLQIYLLLMEALLAMMQAVLFFMLMHVLPASILTFLSSYSASVSISLLCFLICSGFLHQHSDFYLFIFSSCRSELSFHPVLLHETRATVKASLLFSVCPSRW